MLNPITFQPILKRVLIVLMIIAMLYFSVCFLVSKPAPEYHVETSEPLHQWFSDPENRDAIHLYNFESTKEVRE